MFKSKEKKSKKNKVATKPKPNKRSPHNAVSRESSPAIRPHVRVTIKPPEMKTPAAKAQEPIASRKNTSTSPFNMLGPTDKTQNSPPLSTFNSDPTDPSAPAHRPVHHHHQSPLPHHPPLDLPPPPKPSPRHPPPPLASEKPGGAAKHGEPAAENAKKMEKKDEFREGENDDAKACDDSDCPAGKTAKEEEPCRTDDCPAVPIRKIPREAKKAAKKARRGKKNPLALLGEAIMNAFTDKEYQPKATKEHAKCSKKRKCIEKVCEDSFETRDTVKCRSKPKEFKEIQCQTEDCKPEFEPAKKSKPKSKYERKDQAGKIEKAKICSLPGCPVTKKKPKFKNYIDRGQNCALSSEPSKQPEVIDNRRAETAEGCPELPCRLKEKYEKFFSNCASPEIKDKHPGLAMTCEEAHSSFKAKHSTNSDKNVSIVAHANSLTLFDNPFSAVVKDAQTYPPSAAAREGSQNQRSFIAFEEGPVKFDSSTSEKKIRISAGALAVKRHSNVSVNEDYPEAEDVLPALNLHGATDRESLELPKSDVTKLSDETASVQSPQFDG